jgi:putative sporulation protein YyaC
MSSLYKSYYKEVNLDEFVKTLKDVLTKDIILVNIGTDRNIADSLSPLIGTILKENNFQLPVYGTLSEPIHAVNLEYKLAEIKDKHPNSTILALDACLGLRDCIGEIRIQKKPIKPGSGAGKKLPQVGDYSIVGVVADMDEDVIFINRTIRLDFIYNMAKIIAEGLIKASQYIEVNEVASDIIDEEIKLYRVS